MRDTIYRQDAIDAVNKLVEWYKEKWHESRPTSESLIDVLNDLPSAQSQWIPCSERLPSKGEYVLTMLEYKYAKHMGVMKRVNDYPKGEVWEDDFGYSVCDERVPAWMPLPKPYRGESE